MVREQEGLRSDIFRSFTAAKDTQGAIKALKKYGPEEPRLYVDALTYFASSPKILEEAGDELDAVLKKIDDEGLMSPLQVIQALSNNAVVTMGRLKKYLSDNIERERKEISSVSAYHRSHRILITNRSTEPPPDIKLQHRNRNQKTRNRTARHQTRCLPSTPMHVLRWRPRSPDNPLPLQTLLPPTLSKQGRRRR